MIKNIIFDLGGVIVDFNPVRVLSENFTQDEASFILDNIFHSPEWNEVDRGTLTVDCFEKFREDLGDETYEKLHGILVNWDRYMPPFDDMYELVKKLKAEGMKIYLLSNVPPYIHRMTEYVPALMLFDGIVASADIKMIKPERQIFEYTLKKFGIKGEESIFIDDMQRNTDAAAECGINVHCFKNHDMAALMNTLRENGVNI